MREIPLTDIERLFDNLLQDVSKGIRTTEECLDECRQQYPELVPHLELAFAMRSVSLDTPESDAARERVWRRIVADSEGATETRGLPERRRIFTLHSWNTRWRMVALCAAVLALILMGNWALTTASADALPGSPLYSVKRADENIQLRLAWSDQMRGEILAQIALHRLAEAHAEAARNNTSQALTLMNECNDATTQLISLAVTLHQQGQDDDTVTSALSLTLQAENDALAQAQKSGQSTLAQALTSIVNDQQDTLNAGNVSVPPLTTPTPTGQTTPATGAHPTHTPQNTTPTSQLTPTPHPTHTPKATPTPKPSPTPKPTPAPNQNGDGDSNSIGGGHGSYSGGKFP